jgi:hypothetical protein
MMSCLPAALPPGGRALDLIAAPTPITLELLAQAGVEVA